MIARDERTAGIREKSPILGRRPGGSSGLFITRSAAKITPFFQPFSHHLSPPHPPSPPKPPRWIEASLPRYSPRKVKLLALCRLFFFLLPSRDEKSSPEGGGGGTSRETKRFFNLIFALASGASQWISWRSFPLVSGLREKCEGVQFVGNCNIVGRNDLITNVITRNVRNTEPTTIKKKEKERNETNKIENCRQLDGEITLRKGITRVAFWRTKLLLWQSINSFFFLFFFFALLENDFTPRGRSRTRFSRKNCKNSNACQSIEKFFFATKSTAVKPLETRCMISSWPFTSITVRWQNIGISRSTSTFDKKSLRWGNFHLRNETKFWILTILEGSVPSPSHPLHHAQSSSKGTNSRPTKHDILPLIRGQSSFTHLHQRHPIIHNFPLSLVHSSPTASSVDKAKWSTSILRHCL